MLANVQARTREIGIRKALGATSKEIRLQFLVESVSLSLSGGIIGTVAGAGDTRFGIALLDAGEDSGDAVALGGGCAADVRAGGGGFRDRFRRIRRPGSIRWRTLKYE